MRHVVGIYLEMQYLQETRRFMLTGTVFSVEDRWLIMTAGHNITDIEIARRQGARMVRCLLVDCMGEGARFENQIPLSYDDMNPLNLGKHESIDYGFVVPPLNTCRLLQANNIEPLSERAWAHELPEVKDYYLLGFPGPANIYSGNLINVKASMFRLSRYAERPEDFPDPVAPLFFYGRVIENPLGTVAGCSGGPIVAVSDVDPDGNITYTLEALQSKQMGQDIKGMLMRPLGELIRDILNNQDNAGDRSTT
jgi:hypothetical protein